MQTVADEAGIARRETASRVTKQILEAKVIVTQEPSKGGKPTVYRFNFSLADCDSVVTVEISTTVIRKSQLGLTNRDSTAPATVTQDYADCDSPVTQRGLRGKKEGEPPSIDQAKIQGGEPSAVEKDARPSLYVREKAKANGAEPRWCMTSLHAELYSGIYRKDIENRFFDCRNLSFDEQLAECIEEAVRNLALKRTRRFVEAHLDAREVEAAAIARLQTAKQVLANVADYGTRCTQAVAAVCRAVVEATAGIIELRTGPVSSNDSP